MYEAMAVVALSVAMYFLIRDGMHIALKILCGLLIVASAANGLGDYVGYQNRLKTIRKLEAQT